jgi:hypothetical protein
MQTRLHLSLLLMACWIVTAAFAASNSGTTQIGVVIREQQEFVQSGTTMVLKIRLSPGITAKIWRDVRCASPNGDAQLIRQSGVYTLPIVNPQDQGYYCLLSDDQLLRAAVPIY